MKQKYFNLLFSAVLLLSTALTGVVQAQLIKTTPVVTAGINQQYRYDVNVWPLGDSTFTLIKSLPSMTINASTGVITWTPTGLDQGGQVTVRATAGTNTEDQSFYIYISDAVVCDESMISYWKLEETSGTSFADFKGGYSAITGVAPDDTIGVVGIGQKFDPARDIRLTVQDNQNQYDWNQGQDVSGVLWFRCGIDIDSDNGPQVLMGRLGTAGGTGNRHWWWFGLDTNNYLSFYGSNNVGTLNEGDPGYPNQIGGHSAWGVHYSDYEWHHAAFTLDGNASNAYILKLYIDGVEVGSASKTLQPGDFTSTADLNIGWWQNPWGADFEFQGLMDEVAFYKRALTAADIYKMYTDGVAKKPYCQPGNYAPLFKSEPVTAATEDQQYTYNIVTADYDLNTLTITKASGPAWLSVNSTGNGTATLSGTPVNGDVGPHAVTIAVNDGKVAINQSFTVTVANVNDPPTITSTPVVNAAINTLYEYWVTANDVDANEVLSCVATLKPDWATFSFNSGTKSGLLTGTPVATDPIIAYAALKVSDSNGGEFTQEFTITVEGGFSSIDELGDNAGVKVYPSPAREYVWIAFEDNFRNGKFQLFSLSGALLKEFAIHNETTVKVDLSDLKQGIYLYKISNNETQAIGKIAKE